MKQILLNIPLLFILIFLSGNFTYAQDVYLSISGQNTQFLSGDDRHEYDIWIKPEAGADSSILQVYDAGLGGAVDLITRRSNTETLYQIFSFDEKYELSPSGVQPVENVTEPSSTLLVQNEERFKNRWVPLTELSPGSNNGYLLRVSTSEGADVNNFNLRIVNQNGEVVSGQDWNIITFDLSFGFYRSSPSDYFQLRPYQIEGNQNTDLVVSGEEDSQIQKIDAFGEIYSLQNSQIPATKFNLANSWGLNMSGSNEVINNFTIFGTDGPVLWVYDPILITQPTSPFGSIVESVTNSCTELAFELRSNAYQSEALQNTRWLLNEAELAVGQQPLINFQEKGALTINALVPNLSSYFPEYWVYDKEIFVNTPPVAQLTVPKEIISPSEQITISAADSYDPEGQDLEYTWFVNGTRRGIGPTFSFSNTISGSYRISVRVSDGGNTQQCSITEAETRIRINTQPYAEIDYTPLFGTNENVTFQAINQSDADNDPLYYKWESSGVVEQDFGETVTIRHNSPGIYAVTLTVDDSSKATNSSYSVRQEYEVNAAPQLAFSSPEKVAPGNEFILDASATTDQNDTTLMYNWFVDGDFIGGGKTVSYVLDEPGMVDVRLEVDDSREVSNSVQSLTKPIRVNDAPNPIINAPEITSSSLVQFKANEFDEIQSYQWSFGDGNTASGPEAEHLFQKSGKYTITLTVDDGEGLSNSIQRKQQELVINKFPEARFNIPEVVAPAENFLADGGISFDGDGFVEVHEWYINGLPAGNGMRPTLMIPRPGEHTISLRVKDNSGFDIAQGYTSKSIRVNKAPVPKWETQPEQPVPNEDITFSAVNSIDPDGEIISYKWEFEDGTVLEGAEVSRSFSESGTKNFSLTVTDNDRLSNSTVKIDQSISLNHQPYIVTEPSIVSNKLDINLDASGSYDLDEDPLNFEWTLPDGSKRNESAFSWKAPEPGVHIISLTIKDGKGLSNSQNSELIRVLINRPVKAVVDSMLQSCTGQTVLFNSSRSYDPDGDAFQVSWDFGDGNTSDQANPSHSYDDAGVYQAKLTMNDRITKNETEAIIPVIVEGSPVARMNIADTTICVNSTLDFDGTASTDPSGSLPSFAWDLGDGNSETGPKVRHVFTEPGEYIVSLTVEGSGSGMCPNISQTTANVRVVEGPEANFELPAWTAPGEIVQLDGSNSIADGGFRNVEWLIENEDTTYVESGLQSSHTFDEPGEYFVTLNLETNTTTSCNTVSLTKTIKVNAQPEIKWELPENIAAGIDLKLDASPSLDSDGFITSYRWFYNDSLISTNASEIIKAMDPGMHTFRLQITDNADAVNNSVQAERNIFVNSGPEPKIRVPEIKYVGQQVSMQSLNNRDQDGDELESAWYLDGKEVNEPVFTPTQNRIYRVVLVQDDGRSLPNSIDSAVVKYIPKSLPSAAPEFPEAMIVGGTLSISDLDLKEGWRFKANERYMDSWTASDTPNDSLSLAWIFEDQELVTTAFEINTADSLMFMNEAEVTTLEWNPANPSTILEAPSVNRDPATVKYYWKLDGDIIGEGIRQEVPLQAGENRFTVQVVDLDVEQSSPVETEIVIITE